MANGKQLREMLAKSRDQKFRKQTEAQIYGYMKLSQITKEQQQNKEMMDKKRKKIRDSKARAVVTPYGEFDSVGDYYEANPSSKVFGDLCKIKPHLYYYKHTGPGPVLYEEVLYCPYGCLPLRDTFIGGKQKLQKLCKQNGDELALKYKDFYAWFRKACKVDPDNYYVVKEPKREWALYNGDQK